MELHRLTYFYEILEVFILRQPLKGGITFTNLIEGVVVSIQANTHGIFSSETVADDFWNNITFVLERNIDTLGFF